MTIKPGGKQKQEKRRGVEQVLMFQLGSAWPEHLAGRAFAKGQSPVRVTVSASRGAGSTSANHAVCGCTSVRIQALRWSHELPNINQVVPFPKPFRARHYPLQAFLLP